MSKLAHLAIRPAVFQEAPVVIDLAEQMVDLLFGYGYADLLIGQLRPFKVGVNDGYTGDGNGGRSSRYRSRQSAKFVIQVNQFPETAGVLLDYHGILECVNPPLGDTVQNVLTVLIEERGPVAGFAIDWADKARQLSTETLNTMALIHDAEAYRFAEAVKTLYNGEASIRDVVDQIAAPAGYGIPGISKFNIQGAVLDFIRVSGTPITPAQFEDRYSFEVTFFGRIRAR